MTKKTKKTAAKKTSKKETRKIVRTQSAGVFFGHIKRRNGAEVEMINARRIWYWDGAASLSQLAQSGTVCPDKCKFPEPVSRVILLGAIEILDVTEAAAATMDAVPIWHR